MPFIRDTAFTGSQFKDLWWHVAVAAEIRMAFQGTEVSAESNMRIDSWILVGEKDDQVFV